MFPWPIISTSLRAFHFLSPDKKSKSHWPNYQIAIKSTTRCQCQVCPTYLSLLYVYPPDIPSPILAGTFTRTNKLHQSSTRISPSPKLAGKFIRTNKPHPSSIRISSDIPSPILAGKFTRTNKLHQFSIRISSDIPSPILAGKFTRTNKLHHSSTPYILLTFRLQF